LEELSSGKANLAVAVEEKEKNETEEVKPREKGGKKRRTVFAESSQKKNTLSKKKHRRGGRSGRKTNCQIQIVKREGYSRLGGG